MTLFQKTIISINIHAGFVNIEKRPVSHPKKNYFCDDPGPLFFCMTKRTHDHATTAEIVETLAWGRGKG
jgi:hypothetical protein